MVSTGGGDLAVLLLLLWNFLWRVRLDSSVSKILDYDLEMNSSRKR